MTDVTIPADLADRLRQAADMLEIPCQKDEIGGACPCQVYHYSAALLRAVAEQHPWVISNTPAEQSAAFVAEAVKVKKERKAQNA